MKEAFAIKEIMKTRWNRAATVFDRSPGHGIHSEKERQAWMHILAEAVGKERQRILDVGAGTGAMALLLAEMGHEVTGIDIAEKMLEKAATKAKRLNLALNLQIGDAEEPPFPDTFFDAVITRHVLWSLPNPEKALTEWKRVLKPGGKLVIIDGNWRNELTFLKKAWRFFARFLVFLTEGRWLWGWQALDKGLPMRQKKRPEADVEMLQSLGFEVSVRMVDVAWRRRFLNHLKYGYMSSEHFVLTAIKT